MTRRLKVVLDARPLSHPQAGGFRSYVRALLQGLIERQSENRDNHDLLLYLDRELTDQDRIFVPPGATVRILTQNRIKADLLRFPKAIRDDKPDLVHGTMNYLPFLGTATTTLTVHDAMGIKRYPWESAIPRTPRERFINRYWAQMTWRSAHSARRIITDSHGAAVELKEALNLPNERFKVIYPGILAMPSSAPRKKEYSVLAIASPDPRKNIDLLYRALASETKAFPNEIPPRLDLICSSDSAARRAEEAVTKYRLQNTRLLRGFDDTALQTAYAASGVFAWPSLREGFGLPPLEAMCCGCPVAASKAPVMPEVLGDAARYFSPDNPFELAATLTALLTESETEHQARLQIGREKAAQYTCRRMADETVAVWQAVAGERV